MNQWKFIDFVRLAPVIVVAVGVAVYFYPVTPSRSSERQVVEVTYENFNELFATRDKVVLLWFWSAECVPSTEVQQSLDTMADSAQGRYLVGSVDLGRYGQLGEIARITRLPTFVYLRNGNEVLRTVGVRSAETLEREMRAALLNER